MRLGTDKLFSLAASAVQPVATSIVTIALLKVVKELFGLHAEMVVGILSLTICLFILIIRVRKI